MLWPNVLLTRKPYSGIWCLIYLLHLSLIYISDIRIILLDTSVRVCFRVCVHIICIHLLPMGNKRNGYSSCSWVEFPLPLGSTLFVFFRWPMFYDSHLCLSLFHMLFVKCGIIFMLAKNIYCSLTIQYMTSTRTVFLSPMISGAFWRYIRNHMIHAYILYIYIHTFIYVIIVLTRTGFILYNVDV